MSSRRRVVKSGEITTQPPDNRELIQKQTTSKESASDAQVFEAGEATVGPLCEPQSPVNVVGAEAVPPDGDEGSTDTRVAVDDGLWLHRTHQKQEGGSKPSAVLRDHGAWVNATKKCCVTTCGVTTDLMPDLLALLQEKPEPPSTSSAQSSEHSQEQDTDIDPVPSIKRDFLGFKKFHLSKGLFPDPKQKKK